MLRFHKLSGYVANLFLAVTIIFTVRTAEAQEIVNIANASFDDIEISRFSEIAISNTITDIHPAEILKQDDKFAKSDDIGKVLVSDKAYWLRFSIANNSEGSIEAVLLNNYAFTGDIRLYRRSGSTVELIEKVGMGHPFFSRFIKFRKPAVAFAIRPGTDTYLIRIQSPGLQPTHFKIMSSSGFYKYTILDSSMVFFFVGIFAFSMLYNLFLFMRLRYDYYLMYVFYSVIGFINSTTLIGLPQYVFQNVSKVIIFNFVIQVSTFLTMISSLLFLMSFLKTKEKLPKYHKICVVFTFVCIANVAVILLEFLLSDELKMGSILAAVMPLLLIPLVITIGIKSYLSGYRPAKFFLISWIPFLVLIFAQNFVMLGVWEWQESADLWAFWGSALEICLLSLALGDRVKLETDDLHSQLRTHIEHLDELVYEKTRRIKYILENVQIGIFRITEDGKVDAEYSHACLSIFSKNELRGLHVRDLLYGPQASQKSLSEKDHVAMSSIDMMLGEQDFVFDMNSQNLPTEVHGGNESKLIQLEWAPIIVSGTIQGFLVTARDITYVRLLENENRKTIEEVRLLKNVSKHGRDRVLDYIKSEQELINKTLNLVTVLQKQDTDVLDVNFAVIIRNIHTIKGNARTYGLDAASNIAHECESSVKESKNLIEILSLIKKSLTLLSDFFDGCSETINKYLPDEQKASADVEVLAEYATFIDRVTEALPANDQQLARSISSYFRNRSDGISTIMNPIIKSSVDIAKRLGKENPEFAIEESNIFLKKQFVHNVRSVLVHLVRNSIDHGIENAKERQLAGKPPHGLISVSIEPAAGSFIIHYSDDGRGLAIKKIHEKAIARGLISKDQDVSVEDVSSFIFLPGFSSKLPSEVTDISGRGVGMDAVRETLTELKGNIRIQFFEPAIEHLSIQEISVECLPFAFAISLPAGLLVGNATTSRAMKNFTQTPKSA